MVCPPNHGHFWYLFVIEILTPKSWWVMVGEWYGRPWPLINCCLCRSCRGSCASSGASKPAGPLRPWRGAVEAAPGWKFKNLIDSIRSIIGKASILLLVQLSHDSPVCFFCLVWRHLNQKCLEEAFPASSSTGTLDFGSECQVYVLYFR